MAYWTDKYFGSLYHEIYSQHLLDPQRALEEASFASEVLDLGRRTVLDVACGFGRHARLLASSNRVIAVDRARQYVEAAKTDLSARVASNMLAVQGDMRELPLAGSCIDAAVMLFNSFGYFGADDDEIDRGAAGLGGGAKRQVWKLPSVFYERHLVDSSFGEFRDRAAAGAGTSHDAADSERRSPLAGFQGNQPAAVSAQTVVSGKIANTTTIEDDPNLQVLREVSRVLKPGGGLLLEIPNRRLLLEAVEENPRRLMVLGEYEIHEQFEWDGDRQRLINRTRFVAGDRQESGGYSVRLYEPAEVRELIALAGLRWQRAYGDYEGGRFGPANSDVMLVQATRPARPRTK